MAGIAEALIFGLAVWRVTKMITEEEGPYMVFYHIRNAVGAEVDGIPATWDEMPASGKLFQCPYCLSVWVALLLSVLFFVNKTLYTVIAMALFGSGVTALIEDYYASITNT